MTIKCTVTDELYEKEFKSIKNDTINGKLQRELSNREGITNLKATFKAIDLK